MNTQIYQNKWFIPPAVFILMAVLWYAFPASNTSAQSSATHTVYLPIINKADPTTSATIPSTGLNINFQTRNMLTPTSYLADYGQVYRPQNGYSYGWNRSHTDMTRTRQQHANPLLDSLVRVHENGIWELAMENGQYDVTLSVGDPTRDSVNTVDIEGVLFWETKSLDSNEFSEKTKTVIVTDGRLTLTIGDREDGEVRLNYLTVKPNNNPPVTPKSPQDNLLDLVLINADTDQIISAFDPMPSEAVLNLSQLPTDNFSFIARVDSEIDAAVDSVRFSGSFSALENDPPYTLFREIGGDYSGETFTVGTYTLTIVAYQGVDATGRVLAERVFTFDVITDSATPPPATSTPSPSSTPSPTNTPQPTTTPAPTSTPPVSSEECTETINPDNYNWNNAQPGDVLCIPAGTYHEQITVSENGTASNRITVRGLGEVTLHGGRTALLPECDSSAFGTNDADESYGLYIGSHSYWTFENINITGFSDAGIRLDNGAKGNTFRNMTITNNGTGWNGPGVRFAGTDTLFENMVVLDNAQDAFQSSHQAGNTQITIRNAVLGNTRPHSNHDKKSFNDCTHSDGLQSYDGHANGFVLENVEIFGVTNGLMLGDGSGADSINNFTFRNVYINAYENGIYCQMSCSGFTLQEVTIFMPWMDKSHTMVNLTGNNHTVENSVFYGTSGRAVFSANDLSASNNCSWQVTNGPGQNQNPQFADPPTKVGDMSYDLTPSAACGGYR